MTIDPTPGSSTVLELIGLQRVFGDGHRAVDDVNLSIDEGEFFSLIGPSGCGKTTTLRMIAGLEQPTAGAILLRGVDITKMPSHRRPLHTVFQNYALFPHLNVYKNVAFGLKERRLPRDEIRQKVTDMLEIVELTGRERAKPTELSGGMQQRVALARSLVLEPTALLLDEPLGALDLRLRRQMQRALREIQREVGVTFIYVTHDQEEAFSMSDRVGVMDAGRLTQVDAPRAVYRRPETVGVAEFVGSSNVLSGVVTAANNDGTVSVVLEGSEVTVDGVAGVAELAVDDAVSIIIRPEWVELNSTERPECTFNGQVSDVSFLGSSTMVTVDHAEVGPLTAQVTADVGIGSMGVGDSVTLSWDKEAMWAVRK